MKSRNQFPLYQIAFGLILLGAFLGWLAVLHDLVERDSEVAEARIREAEERYLESLANQLEVVPGSEDQVTEDQVRLAAVTGDYSGVWTGKFEPPRNDLPGLSKWAADLRDDEINSSELISVLQTDFGLDWGHIENGRDRLGAILLRLLRKEGSSFQQRQLLESGIWNYQTREPLNPGFRLLLIKEFEKHWPSDRLERLRIAEEIRAVEGDVSQLDREYEIVRAGEVNYYYTKEQLGKMINDDRVELSSSPPSGRAYVRLKDLERWPYLLMKDGRTLDATAGNEGKRAIYWVGLASLISTVVIVIGAIVTGRRQLQQARARTDLAASVAHELRTPLAGQRVMLESMLRKKIFDEKYLGMALRENERLGSLSEEFLTFSRLERGVLELHQEYLDLTDFLQSVVADLSAQFGEDASISLKGEAGVMVEADQAALSTVMRNLVENARKYSDSPHSIEVSVFDGGFSVRDEGVGIPQNQQKKIFRKFYRVDQRLSRSQDGLGLGLSIVKRLVEAMKGTITVESEVGKGSTFTVRLPKVESR